MDFLWSCAKIKVLIPFFCELSECSHATHFLHPSLKLTPYLIPSTTTGLTFFESLVNPQPNFILSISFSSTTLGALILCLQIYHKASWEQELYFICLLCSWKTLVWCSINNKWLSRYYIYWPIDAK